MPSLLGSPPLPSPVPVESHPNRAGGSRSHSPGEQRALPDPSRLAPEDAYYAPSLLKARAAAAAKANRDDSLRTLNGNGNSAAVAALRPLSAVPNPDAGSSQKDVRSVRGTSRRRRRRKGAWKKLLWVKQSCMGISLYVSFYAMGMAGRTDSEQQTRIITPTQKPFSIISSGTHVFALMISGRWWLIRQSSCNMFVPSLSSSAVSSVSSRVE